MKTLTFNIICSLLFGLESGPKKEKLIRLFQEMIEGMWSIPINLPFTNYNRSLRASAEVKQLVKELVCEKRIDLNLKGASSNQDLITSLLSVRDENNKEIISENEIVHNVMLIMVAGHDTSSVVITFMMRLLANNTEVYKSVLQGKHFLNLSPQNLGLFQMRLMCHHFRFRTRKYCKGQALRGASDLG